MDNKRRQFLKSGLAVGGVGAFAAGYATTTKHMVEGIVEGKAGQATRDPHHGNSLESQRQSDPQSESARCPLNVFWLLDAVRPARAHRQSQR